ARDRALATERGLAVLEGDAGRVGRERPYPLRHEAADAVHRLALGGRRRRVRAEDLQVERAPLDAGARLLDAPLLAVALEVEEEDVLPRPPAVRTRLDLDEVDAVRRERTQHVREDAHLVAHGEHERRAVVARGLRDVLRADDEEAREIPGLVLDRAREGGEAVHLRRGLRGDRRDAGLGPGALRGTRVAALGLRRYAGQVV